jgi:hypothetical protein
VRANDPAHSFPAATVIPATPGTSLRLRPLLKFTARIFGASRNTALGCASCALTIHPNSMKDRYFKFLALTIIVGVIVAIVAPAKASAETVTRITAARVCHHHHHHHLHQF